MNRSRKSLLRTGTAKSHPAQTSAKRRSNGRQVLRPRGRSTVILTRSPSFTCVPSTVSRESERNRLYTARKDKLPVNSGAERSTINDFTAQIKPSTAIPGTFLNSLPSSVDSRHRRPFGPVRSYPQKKLGQRTQPICVSTVAAACRRAATVTLHSLSVKASSGTRPAQRVPPE